MIGKSTSVSIAGCIFCLCVAQLHGAEPLVQGDPQSSLLYLLSGLESNLSKFQSGSGQASWTISSLNGGTYLDFPVGTTRTTAVEFAFDGPKLRWDRVVSIANSKGSLPNKFYYRQALNGTVEYETGVIINSSQYGDTAIHDIRPMQAYVRSGGSSASGSLVGARVDVKYLMEPVGMPIKVVRDLLQGKPGEETIKLDVLEVTRASDGLVSATIRASKGSSKTTVRLTFDTRRGYNIVHEEGFQDGKKFMSVDRTFTKAGDGWFMSSFEHTFFHTADGTVPTGKSSVTISDFQPNAPVAPDRFEITGLNLAVNAMVYDLVAGVKFKPRIDEILEQRVAELSTRLRESPYASTPPLLDGEPTSLPSLDSTDSRTQQVQNAESSNRNGVWIIPIVGVSVLLAGVSLWWWLGRSRKR